MESDDIVLSGEELKKLRHERNTLEAIFNSNIEGTFTINNDWEITSFNKSAEKITGFAKEHAIGKRCWEIFNSAICRNGCHMEHTMLHSRETIGNELHIHNKEQKKIPIRVNSNVLIDHNGNRIGAIETFIDISEIKYLSDHLAEKFSFSNIIGRTKQMEKIFQLTESVSQTDSTVLITGESGTGKELVARAIHLNSARQSGPFIALNCSGFVESLIESELFGHVEGAFTGAIKTKIGRFEMAQGGTLFLDEIGDISQSLQTKLLRVIETREFEKVGSSKTQKMDVRIIAATNKNLAEEITAGRFRQDFYYRINVMNIHLPPLRNRMDDLPFLIDHFIKSNNEKFSKRITSLSPHAFNNLKAYQWPGNIRELENVIEHAFILCDGEMILSDHLPERITVKKPEGLALPGGTISQFAAAEKELLTKALERNNYNKKATAEELGIHVTTLWRKLKKP